MPQSESIGNLASALAAVQAEMSPVKKDQTNPFFKSKFAGLAGVVQAGLEVTSKHELAVVQFPATRVIYDTNGNIVGRMDVLATTIMHSSGEWITEDMELRPVERTPQSQGSAITYGRRYAFQAALGIVTEEDDDGNRGSGRSAGGGGQAASPPARTRRPPPSGTADEPPLEDPPPGPGPDDAPMFTDDDIPADPADRPPPPSARTATRREPSGGKPIGTRIYAICQTEGWNMFDVIEQIVGRRVTHTDQLTADEQSTVYAALKEMQKT
jgi:hypothetical protein